MKFRVRIPLSIDAPGDRAPYRDNLADALTSVVPDLEPAVTIAPEHGLDVRLVVDAAGVPEARRKAGYWLQRAADKTRAFTYIPDERSLALMEVEPA